MSKIIAGQRRLLEKSSKIQAVYQGLVFDAGQMLGAQKNPEQEHVGHTKQISKRGRGGGKKGEIAFSSSLRGTTFVEPFSHFSVGFELAKEDAKDLERAPMLKRRGKRKIVHPERQGKSDKSGRSLPHRKEHIPPKKVSDLMKKEVKKVIKRKRKAKKDVKKMETKPEQKST